MQTYLLTICSAFTVFMHFILPYAALAQESSHAPPGKDVYHQKNQDDANQVEHELHHELPPHIEAEENELEELEMSDNKTSKPPVQHIDSDVNKLDKLVFLYPIFGRNPGKTCITPIL